MVFIPATPRSELKRLVEGEIRESNLKIKVVERSGTKVKRMLQKNDPFKNKKCDDPACMICSTTGKGSCRKNGITYKMTCKGDCEEFRYKGETHKNGYSRGGEHQKELQMKIDGSVMWKHCVKEHGGNVVDFEMEVIDYIRNDPTLRQITEAIRIEQTPREKRINDATEWNVGRLPRIAITT